VNAEAQPDERVKDIEWRETDVIVSPDAHGSPFAGITLGQARVFNSAFAGLPVEVYGGQYDVGPRVFICHGLTIPSIWPMMFWPSVVGDLRLGNARLVDGYWISDRPSQRIMSASLVRRIDALAMDPPYFICETCGTFLTPDQRMVDLACLGSHKYVDGEWEWSHRLECGPCWEA
jgi:hypothetical protein